MDKHDSEEQLVREFKLSPQQAKFVILVASGMKPFDACKEAYNYTSVNNVYGPLRTLTSNDRVDAALQGLGLNLRDRFAKQAYSVVSALEEIAFSESTSTRDKLSALKELAAYNPMLQKMRGEDADDQEESKAKSRIEEYLAEE
jgi:hypothetical protein